MLPADFQIWAKCCNVVFISKIPEGEGKKMCNVFDNTNLKSYTHPHPHLPPKNKFKSLDHYSPFCHFIILWLLGAYFNKLTDGQLLVQWDL